jgi:hypothetical protein
MLSLAPIRLRTKVVSQDRTRSLDFFAGGDTHHDLIHEISWAHPCMLPYPVRLLHAYRSAGEQDHLI